MKNVLALEMRKAFRNRSFLAVVLIGCVLGLLSAWMCLMQYGQDTYYFQIEADSGYISNPMLEVESFYTYWIVMDGFTLFSSLLFYLLPLLSTLGATARSETAPMSGTSLCAAGVLGITLESTSPRFCPAALRCCCRFCSIFW